jgi:hypothetical protein
VADDLSDLAGATTSSGVAAWSVETRRMRALSPGRPAQPGLARWSPWSRERVDLGRAVVVDEQVRPKSSTTRSTSTAVIGAPA